MYGEESGVECVVERSRPVSGRDLVFAGAASRTRIVYAASFCRVRGGFPIRCSSGSASTITRPPQDRLSRLLYLDTKTYLNSDILTKVDRMSMATSLEVRVPMLDHEFLEWVTSLPVELKFRDGVRKHILKKLAERLGIPSALLHRKKQGFQLPLVEWMRNEMKTKFWGILLEPRMLSADTSSPRQCGR